MSRNTWIVVAVAVVLIALGVWKMKAPAERGISRVSLAEVDPAKIDKVELSGKNAATLVKEGDAWKVDGKEADPNAIKTLTESIPKIASADLVTRSKDRWTELGVDDAAGARVKAYAGGKTVADFVVGKAGGGGANVRIGDEVYLVPKVFPGAFAKEKKQWADRKLFKDPLGQVTRVEVKPAAAAGAKPWALTKSGETWSLEDPSVLPKGFRFDATAARNFVATLANAAADELPDADPGVAATGLEGDGADRYTFVIGTAGTATRELVLGKEKDPESKAVWAKPSTRTYPVTLQSQIAASLRKQPTDMRDMTLMTIDRTKVKKLSIDDGKNRWTASKGDAGWKLDSHSEKTPEGFEFDPMAVERKVSALAGARAQKLGSSFSPSGAKVTATLEGGSTVTLSFGATKKEDPVELVEVKGNADGASYLAPLALQKNLTAGIASLRKAPGGGDQPMLDPHALQNLPPEVRDAFMKQQAERAQQQKLMEMIQKQQSQQPPPQK